MKKLLLSILTIITLLFNISCNKKEFKTVNPEFINYISSYTTGLISAKSSIKIRLSQNNSGIKKGDDAGNLVSFEPSLKGTAIWVNNRTIEFTPDKKLPSGQLYDVTFNLKKVQEVPNEFEKFQFSFQVINQFLDVQLSALQSVDPKKLDLQRIEGTVETADIINSDELSKIFEAQMSGKDFAVKFKKSNNSKIHNFYVDSIPRSNRKNTLKVNWDGDPINVDTSGKLSVEIPALGDFKVLKIRVYNGEQQYISVLFSDPVDPNQNFRGLIDIAGINPKFTVNGNEVKVYSKRSKTITGTNTIIVQNIRNTQGIKLKEKKKVKIEFKDIKPNLELLGKGTILPNNKGIKFPFKATNLKAVKVKVLKIYEDNVAQFLQVNQINGQREVKRVGRVVYKSIVDLKSNKAIDYSKSNAFSLQLDKLIEPEPGAIYRVELSFGLAQSLYTCSENSKNSNDLNSSDEEDDNWDANNFEEENSYWDYYQEESTDYSQRNNPCNPAYYKYNTTSVSRNVLASDLGVIAKLGANQKMVGAVTNLVTTEPISGVELTVLNYQQQSIDKAKTNNNGLAELNVGKKPFLLIASKGKQKGYVRLDNGSSLSTSKFDVSGSVIQKGLKGFIYGERGVWRPGDSIYLNFILQDKEAILPKNHPVSFELFDPQGQLRDSQSKVSETGNIYNFNTSTLEDDETGNWMARVKVGGSIFSKRIKIETVKPNRLKVNLDFGRERLSAIDNNVTGILSSKWLHGAIAKNLDANVKVSLSETKTNFKKYADYIFDDPAINFLPEDQTLFNGALNEKGEAKIRANINVENYSPGMLNANFLVRVYEEGGDFSIDKFTIPYAPYKSFVGIKLPKGDKARGMLLTDKNHPIQIVSLDPDGKPVDTNVKVDIFKIEWKYWWEKNNDEDLSNYTGSSTRNRIFTTTTSTSNGTGVAKFEVKYPEWGRYYVRVTDTKSNHSTGKIIYIDWPGWAGRASKDNPGGASMLVFSTDKTDYKVGEKVNVSIPTSDKGRALVSIESGSKVIQNYWVEADGESTQFSFKTTAEMAPNVYISVTLIQPHNYEGNDLPIRLYGITPINVEDPETRINPTLKMPDELHPEEEVTIEVGEENNNAMEYTVAIVDEGLLDITRYKTPNPWNTFYAREALGVRSWDMYEYVMGAYAGTISGLLQIGGDDELGKKGGQKANRFKPVVKFMGPFKLKKGGKNKHTFTMPQYIGAVKTMIVASNGNAYGATDKSTPVKQPLMVLATLPRVISPTEQVKVPVSVFAMNNSVQNATIKIKTKGLLKINGGNSQTIKFNEPGEQLINFDLTASKEIGNAKVEIIATSGSNTANHTIDLQVRLPNPPSTTIKEKVINPGESWNPNFELTGIKGTNKAYVEISNIPAINLEERLKYLIKYPHGCVEQTTSSGFPQLYLNEIAQLSEAEKNETAENVRATINKLLQFQNSSGGFSYWTTSTKADDWASSYVGHFLIEAKSKGYAIPSGMLSKWGAYQKKIANNWTSDNLKRGSLLQAYRLYTLALANKAEMGAMNRLKEKENLSPQTLWRLAATYSIAGQKDIANELVFGTSTDITPYKEMDTSYGSNIRDKAMILETLVLLDKKEKAANLLKSLSNDLSTKKWMSTQTTAYSLIAVSKFVIGNNSDKQINYSYTLNNQKESEVLSTKSISKQSLSTTKISNSINLKNKSDGILFARIVTEGVPLIDNTTDQNNDLQMQVSYYDLDGKTINPNILKQGTDFKVEVKLKNPGYKGDYKQMALTQLLPSGWEIQNIRLNKVGEKHLKSKPDYMDLRDDRVHYYFDLKEGETKTFVTLANASYLGKFFLPSVVCEAMYDNTISARKSGKWVEVVK